MEWNMVKSPDDIDYLLKTFNNFHDSCIVLIKYESGAYVNKSNSSMQPLNTKRILSVVFQSQFKSCYSVEIVFNKLVKLNLQPIDENYDCIINSATLKKVDNYFLWEDSSETCLIECKEIMWRKI